jgi:hypothetical protein
LSNRNYAAQLAPWALRAGAMLILANAVRLSLLAPMSRLEWLRHALNATALFALSWRWDERFKKTAVTVALLVALASFTMSL